MKKLNGYDNVEINYFEKLCAGGYICNIKNAKIETYEGTNKDGNKYKTEKLVIAFDIAEGEFRGYYNDNYDSQPDDDKKKWKGIIRLTVPDENYQFYEAQLKNFKRNMTAVEDSNDGFVWDWDEKSLKGKYVGILFGDKEWDFNGKTGFYAEPRFFVSVDRIKEGDFKIPKTKYLDEAKHNALSSLADKIAEEDDDDLPF